MFTVLKEIALNLKGQTESMPHWQNLGGIFAHLPAAKEQTLLAADEEVKLIVINNNINVN